MSEQVIKTGASDVVPSETLLRAVAALRAGRMVIMVDDEDRENEGDLVMAAEFITPSAMNFMISQARGLVCLPLEGAHIDRLGLPMMVSNNTSRHETGFTVSIEAKEGVSTGISAADRALTVQVAVSETTTAADLATPGHIFPLRAVDGGVLHRFGHTEGSVDLLKLSGLHPAAVICEILNEDGTMARRPELEVYSRKHNMPIISIAELVSWISQHGLTSLAGCDALQSQPVERPLSDEHLTQIAISGLPGEYGGEELRVHAFRDSLGVEHLALVKGDPSVQGEVPLVRLHSECVTGDALGSLRCDCGAQLHVALRRIGQAKSGVLVYVRDHEGRGIGLANKIRAYELQDMGFDTVEANHRLGFEADTRDWTAAAAILRDLGITQLDLLTNNPDKVESLEKRGFVVRKQVPIEIIPNRFNRAYLETKQQRMGHRFSRFVAVDEPSDVAL